MALGGFATSVELMADKYNSVGAIELTWLFRKTKRASKLDAKSERPVGTGARTGLEKNQVSSIAPRCAIMEK